jgi:beta-galactosidase/beta-glucuronidase
LAAQIALARHSGLNAIRLEGKMESEMFYDMLDSLGMLALPGW